MKKITLLRFLPFLFLMACTQTPDEDIDTLQPVSFSVIPSAGQDPASGNPIATRARVNGTFAVESQVGLGIERVDGAMSGIYTNFFTRFNGTDWLYYLDGISNGTLLSGFASWGEINIYGYYPYNNAVTNLEQVPFRIASNPAAGVSYALDSEAQTDYMVAASKTKNMSDAGTATSTVPLEFSHLMTAIEFSVRRLNYNGALPLIKLDKVVYEISGVRSFGIAGTYTAKNPDMANMSANLDITESANRLEITYPNSANITSTSYTDRLLVIFPELRLTTGSGRDTDNNATVTLTFHFTDQDGTPYVFEEEGVGNPSVSFELSEITNSGNDKGLLAGYTYTIQATVGTYTKFTVPTGPTIVDEPLDDDTPPVFIEI